MDEEWTGTPHVDYMPATEHETSEMKVKSRLDSCNDNRGCDDWSGKAGYRVRVRHRDHWTEYLKVKWAKEREVQPRE